MQSKKKYKIYIIVGEESGENLGYEILSSLKKKINYKLYGIGGKKLNSLGLKSIFDFSELSIMGLFEILPKVPKLISLLNKTINNILIVLYNQLLGFNFSLIKYLIQVIILMKFMNVL